LSLKVIFNSFLPGLMLSMLGINAAFAVTFSEQVDDLRAHYLMLQDARTDFQSAQSRGELDATAQSDYLAWIRQLNEQLVQQCNMLTNTNQAALPDDLPCDQALASGLAPAVIDLAAEHTEAEQTDTLIEELNATLGEFDERLLQEQARVKAQVPRTESSGGDSGGGGSGDGSSGEGTPGAQDDGAAGQGTDIAADGEQGSEQSDKQGGGSESQATREQASADREGPSSEPGSPGASGKAMPGRKSDVPENIPDGSDDDVVARQLREAAEKETDPELKKKLWEEYRRYKEGTS
jgi:hypothetical protein